MKKVFWTVYCLFGIGLLIASGAGLYVGTKTEVDSQSAGSIDKRPVVGERRSGTKGGKVKEKHVGGYIGSGAGSPGFEGYYAPGANYTGKPTYFLDTTVDKYAWWDGSQWKLGTAVGGINSETYYLNDSQSATLPLTGWQTGAFTQGIDPAPSFSLVPTISIVGDPTIRVTRVGGGLVSGDYPPAGTHNGATYFQLASDQFLAWGPGGKWWLGASLTDIDESADVYYSSPLGGSITEIPSSGWGTHGGGAPAPTFSLVPPAGAAAKSGMFMFIQ